MTYREKWLCLFLGNILGVIIGIYEMQISVGWGIGIVIINALCAINDYTQLAIDNYEEEEEEEEL